MEERIDEVVQMYLNCFKDINNLPICKETAILEFNINPELVKESLIAMDKKIYRQKQSVRDLCLLKTYPDNKKSLYELCKRLNNVHEEIYDIF